MPQHDTLTELSINPALVERIITDFIRHEIEVVGFSRAVIALSGGVDSSLVTYLTAKALGPENVLVVRMPYETSSSDSLDHAELVIEDLGVRHETIPITPMVEPYLRQYPDMNNVRRGNVMTRQRMIIMYDQSEEFGGLVVGTGNKTEALLGYSTVFGVDSAAAIQPIADLYKYQVRQLAKGVGVPGVIINKPPSADLWPGQTDEQELGYTYDEADQVLYLMVDRRYQVEDVTALGFDEALVNRVWKRVRQMQYKRRMPLIPKISQRTLGHDFRYLRDWGARYTT
jgi:NAD+ synthase